MTRTSIIKRGAAALAISAAALAATTGLSDASAAAPAAATLTTSGSATVLAGTTTSLTLTLRSATTGAIIPNVTVTLWSRPWPTTTWSDLISVRTNASGVALVRVAPLHDTQYEWTFAGNSQFQAETSGVVSLWVAQAITITANHPSATTLNVWGGVTPNETGQIVVLQRLINGVWTSLGSGAVIKTQKMPNGVTATGYNFHLSGLTLHAYDFRAFRSATSINAQGFSPTLHVTF